MHVYPHPELPLLPKLLLPALDGQEVVDLAGMASPAPARSFTRLEFCQALTPVQHEQAAEIISALVQKICFGRTRRDAWAAQKIAVASGVQLCDLILTDRAQVSLQKHAFFAADGPWRNASVGEIIGPRISRPRPSPSDDEQDEALRTLQAESDADTIEETGRAHRIGARLLMAFLLAAEKAMSDGAAVRHTVCASIEQELAQAVRSVIHSHRTAAIYLDMKGWSGKGPRTLTQIAQAWNMTHERARQIGLSAVSAMAAAAPARHTMPLLKQAIKAIRTAAPCSVDEASNALYEEHVCDPDFTVASLLQAAERFGIESTLTIHRVDGQDFVVERSEARHLVSARHTTRKLLRTSAILSVTKLMTDCMNQIARADQRLDPARIQRLVECSLHHMPGWSFLDTDRRWATVTVTTDGEDLHLRGPVARIARMALFYGGISLGTAQQVLQRLHQAWPADILLALCLRMGLTVRPRESDWWIEARGELAQRVQQAMKATTEYDMAVLLRSAGGQLSRSEMMERCEKAGIHRSTTLASLKSASLFVLDSSQCKLATLLDPALVEQPLAA